MYKNIHLFCHERCIFWLTWIGPKGKQYDLKLVYTSLQTRFPFNNAELLPWFLHLSCMFFPRFRPYKPVSWTLRKWTRNIRGHHTHSVKFAFSIYKYSSSRSMRIRQLILFRLRDVYLWTFRGIVSMIFCYYGVMKVRSEWSVHEIIEPLILVLVVTVIFCKTCTLLPVSEYFANMC